MKKQTNNFAKVQRYKRTRAQKHRGLRMEMLEGRRVMAADTQLPLHNALIAPDVNRDFAVSPLDALLVINALNAQSRGKAAGEGEGPYSYTPSKETFLDVSNDGYVSPLDALLVINQLRGEGEDLKLVSFTVEFLNAAGNVVTQASVGETITARINVKDLRTLANIRDLPDIDILPDTGANTFPNPNDGDIDRNGNGIFDFGPDDSFATGVFSAGIDLDLTGSESVTNLVSQVRTGSFLNSLTFGPRLSAFPDGRPGAVDSNEEFNEISAFDLTLPNPRLPTLQDQGINPTREEFFFSARFTLLKPGSFTITPNFAETAFGADGLPSLSPTFIRTYRGASGIAVPEAQQLFVANTLTIAADPSAPVAVNDTRDTNEDTALNLANANLTSNDTVTAPRTLSLTSVSVIPNVTLGTVSGQIYTPPANFSGQDRVTYTITDSTGLTSSATVTINVAPVNDPPVAVADTPPSVPADTTTDINVLSNDSAGGGETQTLTIVSVGPTSNGGVVTINGSLLAYTPASGFEGVETFQYTMSDGQATASALVTVTVEPATTPFARRDTASITEVSAGQTGSVPIFVLTNDKLNPGAGIRPLLLSFTQPANGTVTRDENGTPADTSDDRLIYVPNFEFNGTDTFTYVMNDTFTPQAANSTGTVVVTVTDVNDAPTAGNDNATGTEDVPVTIAISTLLTNDSPGLGETNTQTLAVTPGTSASGTVAVVGTNVIFTPSPAVNGNQTFTYIVTDSGSPALTATGTVTVNLAAVNDAPIAGADSRSTNEDTQLVITTASLLTNDTPGRPAATDESSQTLSITGVSKPAATTGTVTLTGGNITYVPVLNFNGTETFTYTVLDSAGASSTGTVTVTVNPINDAPIAGADSVVAFKGVALQIPVADLLSNDVAGPADELGQTPLSIVGVSSNALGSNGQVVGTVTLNSGIVTFTPAAGYSGPASFQYTVQDSGPTGTPNVNSGSGRVDVTVRDFVPTSISGNVWVDETNDGIINTAERRLGGVEVVLTGNALGIPIAQRTYVTLADGSYHFDNLAPGQYVVRYVTPSYMSDGMDVAGAMGDADGVANQFTINVAQPGGGNGAGYNFAAVGMEASYGRALDLLASRYFTSNPSMIHKGLYAAIGADNSSLWMAKLDGFDGMVAGEVVLNSAGNRLQMTMVDANQNVYTTALNSSQFVVTTDRTTGNKIIRILGDASSLNFQQISLAAPPVVSINRYLEAIDEIFAQEGWDDNF